MKSGILHGTFLSLTVLSMLFPVSGQGEMLSTAASLSLKKTRIKWVKPTIRVAVIDTGVDFTRGQLARVRGESWDCTSGERIQFQSQDSSESDPHGHGTHVAGLIQRAFDTAASGIPESSRPQLVISSYRYFPSRMAKNSLMLATGDSSTMNVSTVHASNCAIEAALEHEVDLINYSGGGYESSLKERALIARAQKKGVPVIAAAGNAGVDLEAEPFYPASYREYGVIAVAAVDARTRLFPKSNFSAKWVHLAAQGVEVLSDHPSSSEQVAMTGTSQATAIVSGTLAALMALRSKHTQTIGSHAMAIDKSDLDWKSLIDEFSMPVDALNLRVQSGLVLDPTQIKKRLRLSLGQYPLTAPTLKVSIRPI